MSECPGCGSLRNKRSYFVGSVRYLVCPYCDNEFIDYEYMKSTIFEKESVRKQDNWSAPSAYCWNGILSGEEVRSMLLGDWRK